MSDSESTISTETLADNIQNAGVAGAGGAGFPSYAKWTDLDGVNSLLVNHQESEPNFYSDKWLAREHPEAFADLFDALLGEAFDVIVVGTKEKYRPEWTGAFEEAAGASVAMPDDLPLDVEEESGVVFAYTENDYDNSEEPILLMEVADEMLMGDLPTEHGWVVHNTESLYNVYRAATEGTPVTHKYVVVDGDVPEHRLLKAPIGTTAETLLAEAGADGLADGKTMLDGGPGWCTTVDVSPAEFGVRKRTNGLLVVDEETAEDHRDEWEEIRVNLLDERDWGAGDHETEPTEIRPDLVRIPLMTNDAHEGLVAPADPVVEAGDSVEVGDLVAAAVEGEISIPHHASIDGTVSEVTDTHVVVER